MTRLVKTLVAALLAPLTLAGCAGPVESERDKRPDILLVIWDTVRADRMSLYGHEVETTPNVDRWARRARVFDDCVSVSSTTVPTHATLFTGVMPGEHGTHNTQRKLPRSLETIAERLRSEGYRTYLFSANPFVSLGTGLARGFEKVEHPWDPAHQKEAKAITRRKLESAGGQPLIGNGKGTFRGKRRGLGSAGALTHPALLEWLADDGDAPVFVVLNYMEAHQPLLPDPEFQQRTMDAEARQTWVTSDRTFMRMRAFNFGLEEIPAEELDAIAGAYDASIAELDSHFQSLLDGLEALGRERARVLVLTSDHGEHLGEHHLLDHQFSLFEPLLRVPLAIEAPGMEAGRDPSPVSLVDLHPTLLGFAGVETGLNESGYPLARLGEASEGRARVAEYPSAPKGQIRPFLSSHPEWDPEPWRRSWQAIYVGRWKLRVASANRRCWV